MNSRKFLAIVISSIIFYSCDPFDDRLTIINNTDNTIFVELPEEGFFGEYPIKLDSVKQDTLWDYMRYIHPKQSIKIPLMGKNMWGKHINKFYKDSTLIVFIFDKELLERVSPDSLVINQLYTKKFAYKVKDLERLNWRIEYKE